MKNEVLVQDPWAINDARKTQLLSIQGRRKPYRRPNKDKIANKNLTIKYFILLTSAK